MGESKAIYEALFGWLAIDRDHCDGCGECVGVCPYGVLLLDRRGDSRNPDSTDVVAVAMDPGACTCCSACSSVCPAAAISVSLMTSSA